MEICLRVNGDTYYYAAKPDEMLLETLRKLGVKSVKKGCDTTSCGVCSIIVDSKLVPACGTFTIRADGKEVLTVEGLGQEAKEIAKYLTGEGVEQCGYCSPGHVMAIYSLTKEYDQPSEEDVKHYLAGNLCRCSGYVGQHRAILKYLEAKENERT